MAVTRPTDTNRDGTRADGSQTWARPPSRYDAALLAIPVAFLLAVVAHVVLDVPLAHSAAASAVVGVLVLVDALFLNPPTRPRAS